MPELELKETQYSQYFWNITISIIFIAILFLLMSMSDILDTGILMKISPFHFIVVPLATFR